MGLQNDGQISLNDVATEYGGSQPHQLSEYYSKGNAPSSGEIQVAADFYGTSNLIIQSGNGTTSGHRVFIKYDGTRQVIWNDGQYYYYKVSNVGSHQSQGAMAPSFNWYAYLGTDDEGDIAWNSGYIANNMPFPLHSGSLGGWRYFVKRGETHISLWRGLYTFKAYRTNVNYYPF